MSFLFLSVIMFQLFQPAEAALGVSPSAGGPSTAVKYDESAAKSIRAQLEKRSSVTQKCMTQYMESLGWEIVASSQVKDVGVKTGRPCDRRSIEEAKSHDDLLIEFPKNPNDADFEKFFAKQDEILAGDGSKCGFQVLAWRATKTAASKLEANTKHQFSRRKFCELPRDDWMPISRRDACFMAKSRPSSAVECFYDDSCRTECAVGIQAGQLSLLYELYGKEQFDREFQTNEIAVGYWDGLFQTANPFVGSGVKDSLSEFQLADRAGLGPAMLIGNTGAVANLYGEQYLDSPNDRNENFMITDVSEDAARSLAQGGLKRVHDVTVRIWMLNASVSKGEGTAEAKRQAQEEIASLLNDPFLQGTTVYVHPLGTSTLSYHISRLLQLNPRTPYNIRLRGSNLSTEHFARHRKSFVSACIEKLQAPERTSQQSSPTKRKKKWWRFGL